jgi:Sigma-70, region 4
VTRGTENYCDLRNLLDGEMQRRADRGDEDFRFLDLSMPAAQQGPRKAGHEEGHEIMSRSISGSGAAFRVRSEMNADLLAILKFKNLRLYDLIAGRTLKEISAGCGVCAPRISMLLRLKISPTIKKTGNYTNAARVLADYFCVPPEELFPRALCEIQKALPESLEATYDSEKFLPLLAARSVAFLPQYDEDDRIKKLGDALSSALIRLTPREEKLLKSRFGLGGESECTYEEIGNHFGVCRERIRQIELGAFRKLRNPAVLRALRIYLE